jgi:hypothetical protein
MFRVRAHLNRIIVPLTAALVALSACGSDPVPAAQPSGPASSGVPGEPGQPRSKLAARAAAAKDLRQVAFYLLKSPGRPDRTVGFTRATDGSWKVDIPGGAHGGAMDISLVLTSGGLYQCAVPRGCVLVQGGVLPAEADPKLTHLITDWLSFLLDPRQALAVTMAQPLDGAAGECYAIESSAVALPMPLDAGIYCYEKDGTLTAARMSAGTMVLAGKPGAAPPSVDLPGPVVPGALFGLAAPPSPTVSVTPSP